MAGAAQAANTPAQTVQELDQALLSVMRQADQLGYEGRYRLLAPAIDRTFDIPAMTRIVAGSNWNTWTPEQRDQVIDAFRRFITATYARRFDGYSGERFKIDGERPAAQGRLVLTRLERSDGTPVTLNYLLHQNGDDWKIVDVFLTGTISELATRRSEFSAVLQRNGVDGLLTTLDAKISDLAAP